LSKDYKFYYDKKLKRLVIPWSNEYYQERTIFKSQSKEDKYLFPSNSEKPIFGLENIDTRFKYIFLVEGVFDSIWVKNGVAVGSLTLSNHQKELLKPYENDYTIVYLMDNQHSDKSSLEKTIKLCEKNPYANIFIWPKALHMFKDINDTIIFHDKFINVWKDENYLKKYIFNGIRAKLELK
jgi:DNA primase